MTTETLTDAAVADLAKIDTLVKPADKSGPAADVKRRLVGGPEPGEPAGELEIEEKPGRRARRGGKHDPAPTQDAEIEFDTPLTPADVPAAAVVPMLPPGVNVPPLVPAVDGLPSIEADARVKAARERVEGLIAKWREARAEADRAAAVVGLAPGTHHPARMERVAAELIAAGQSPEDVDSAQTLNRTAARLAEAVRIAAPDVQRAIDAVRRDSADAATEFLSATLRPLLLAWLAMIDAANAHRRRVEMVRGAGLHVGNFVNRTGAGFPTDPDGAAPQLREFVNAGYLTREEVNAVLPRWLKL